MILQVYAIKDRQIGAYMTPFFMQSDGQALRSFQDEINREASDNILYRHPEDFALCHMGEFDTNKGLWSMLEAENMLMQGSAAVIKKEVDASSMRLRGVN